MTDGDNKEIPQGPQKKTLKDIFGGPPVKSRIIEPESEAEREFRR